MKQKQGEYKNGFWTPNTNLQVNNKTGHNQHTAKNKLKKEQDKPIPTVDEVKELYQKMRESYRNYLSAVQLHSDAHYRLMGYRAKVELKEDD